MLQTVLYHAHIGRDEVRRPGTFGKPQGRAPEMGGAAGRGGHVAGSVSWLGWLGQLVGPGSLILKG